MNLEKYTTGERAAIANFLKDLSEIMFDSLPETTREGKKEPSIPEGLKKIIDEIMAEDAKRDKSDRTEAIRWTVLTRNN